MNDIPVKKYIQTIDSLNQQSNLGKSYNPFVERPKVRTKIVKKKKSPSQTVVHRVGRGHSLSRIAKVYGVSVDDIAAVNNIRNYHRIYIGQKLTIPGSSKTVKKKIIRPRVTVNGIIWDEFEPYAILNGEMYRVGDELKGYIIQSITDSTILFVSSKHSFTFKKDSFISKYKRE